MHKASEMFSYHFFQGNQRGQEKSTEADIRTFKNSIHYLFRLDCFFSSILFILSNYNNSRLSDFLPP